MRRFCNLQHFRSRTNYIVKARSFVCGHEHLIRTTYTKVATRIPFDPEKLEKVDGDILTATVTRLADQLDSYRVSPITRETIHLRSQRGTRETLEKGCKEASGHKFSLAVTVTLCCRLLSESGKREWKRVKSGVDRRARGRATDSTDDRRFDRRQRGREGGRDTRELKRKRKEGKGGRRGDPVQMSDV